MTESEVGGWLAMLGSLDCMHWTWKNCPVGRKVQYKGHCSDPTIILEAISSNDIWIWHSFVGLSGSHNVLNVLARSPLFSTLINGEVLLAAIWSTCTITQWVTTLWMTSIHHGPPWSK